MARLQLKGTKKLYRRPSDVQSTRSIPLEGSLQETTYSDTAIDLSLGPASLIASGILLGAAASAASSDACHSFHHSKPPCGLHGQADLFRGVTSSLSAYAGDIIIVRRHELQVGFDPGRMDPG